MLLSPAILKVEKVNYSKFDLWQGYLILVVHFRGLNIASMDMEQAWSDNDANGSEVFFQEL